MAISIKTIADECGVSRQAVSNALAGKGRLSPGTRQRIVAVAQELGYRPNSIARTMQSGKFGCVALLMSTDGGRSWMADELLAGIHDELARHDMHLTIARLPDEQFVNDGLVPKLLREWSCDGVLINYIADVPESLVQLIENYHIPSIWLNIRREYDCVHPADFEGAYQATRHLQEQGHRRIAFVEYSFGGGRPHYSIGDRIGGYERAMHEARLQPQTIRNPQRLWYSAFVSYSKGWLQQPDRPTAVLTYSEAETMAVVQASTQLGWAMPRDLSLVTFYRSNPLSYCFGLSYWALPENDMGRIGVQMLQQKIKNPVVPLAPRALPLHYIAGQTVQPLQRTLLSPN
jgi:DNA-binding LacI/PurR family transcriptional regulator